VSTVDLDMADPSLFLQGHPHALYDHWREHDPVHLVTSDQGSPPFWVLTRHTDIDAVSRDPGRFSNAGGFRLPTHAEERSRAAEVSAALGSMLMTMDPPDHTEMRRQLGPPFSPRQLAGLSSQVDEFVDELVVGLRGRDEIEIVSELSSIVPIRTLCALLGIPAEDEQRVLDLTNRTVGASDPEYSTSREEAAQAYADMFAFGADLLAQRQANPTDDVLGMVARMTFHGEPLSENARRGLFTLLVAAGNETTRNALTLGLRALSDNPEQKALLLERPELIPNAALEVLRDVTPVIQMLRVATTDVEIGGKHISRGDRVVLAYGAANRDPEVFARPHELDVTRPDAGRHLAFGVGPHYCLGARVAVMEVGAVLSRLLVEFPDLTVTGEPEYLLSNFVCSVKRLTVSLQGQPAGVAG
jgi:cytochrome P450